LHVNQLSASERQKLPVPFCSFGARFLDGNALHFDVKDKGISSSADQLDAIFEPFLRLVHSGTAGERSAGLGLSIVAQLLAAVGGTIRVESAVGAGSTFHVVPVVLGANRSTRRATCR
jgi:signal transduction histidine kinase